jgi:hypothetical protein
MTDHDRLVERCTMDRVRIVGLVVYLTALWNLIFPTQLPAELCIWSTTP